MICKFCGKENDEKAKICVSCGKDIKINNSKKRMFFVSVLIVFIVAITGVYFIFGEKLGIDDYVANIFDKDEIEKPDEDDDNFDIDDDLVNVEKDFGFSVVGEFKNAVALIEKDDKYGVIDASGNIVLPTYYDEIKFLDDGNIQGRLGENWDVITIANIDKNAYRPYVYYKDYNSVIPISDDTAIILNEGNSYFINTTTDEKISKEYEMINFLSTNISNDEENPKFHQNIFLASNEDGYETLVDVSGKQLLDEFYSNIYYAKEDVFVVSNFDESIFLINSKGEKISNDEYFSYNYISDDIIIVSKAVDLSVLFGVVDINGNEIIPFEYGYIDWLGNDKFSFSNEIDGKRGIIDIDKNVMIEPTYDNIFAYSEGFAVVSNNEYFYQAKFGCINENGELIVPVIYENMDSFKDGFAKICVDEGDRHYGYINTKGEIIVNPEYDILGEFIDGIALVCYSTPAQNRYGYINESGELITEVNFNDAGDFVDGLARVQVINGIMDGYSAGFINQSGERVIDFDYDQVGDFSEGYASVYLNGKCGVINTLGEEVIAKEYDSISCFENGYAVAVKNGKTGLINIENEVIIPFVFDNLYVFSENEYIAEKEGSFGIYNEKGEEIVAPVFGYLYPPMQIGSEKGYTAYNGIGICFIPLKESSNGLIYLGSGFYTSEAENVDSLQNYYGETIFEFDRDFSDCNIYLKKAIQYKENFGMVNTLLTNARKIQPFNPHIDELEINLKIR